MSENELLAQAEDPQKTYIEEIMPAKIALNERYIAHPGILQDLKIMALTAKKIIGF